MMLNDVVNIVTKAAPGNVERALVPAHFGHTATLRTVDRGTIYVERAQVVLGAGMVDQLDPAVHAIEHRGVVWTIDGQPLVRMVRGRVHHITVPLTRSTT